MHLESLLHSELLGDRFDLALRPIGPLDLYEKGLLALCQCHQSQSLELLEESVPHSRSSFRRRDQYPTYIWRVRDKPVQMHQQSRNVRHERSITRQTLLNPFVSSSS